MSPEQRLNAVINRIREALPGCSVYSLRAHQDLELHVDQGSRELARFSLEPQHEYLASPRGADLLVALILRRCFREFAGR